MSNIVRQDPMPAMTISDMSTLSAIFLKSGLFGNELDEAKAIVKIMAGREIGLEPFTAMQGIDIIKGKVSVKPIIIAAKIKQSGKYDYRIIAQTDKRCEIEFFQNGTLIGVSTFTIDDAARMGLASNSNYQKQPAVMLYNRAMSKGARQFCPDAFFGVAVYSEGEIESEPIPQREEIWEMNDRRKNDVLNVAKRKDYSNDDLKQYLLVVHGVTIAKMKDLYTLTKEQYEALVMAMENDTLAEEVLEKAPPQEPSAPEPTEAEKELELV